MQHSSSCQRKLVSPDAVPRGSDSGDPSFRWGDGFLMADEIQSAREVLSAIPQLASRAASARITRLGGLTNLVFRIDDEFCLRIPGKGTEEYINRANEAVAAREAARAGVSPEVLHFDAKTGIMVTRYIDGAVT